MPLQDGGPSFLTDRSPNPGRTQSSEAGKGRGYITVGAAEAYASSGTQVQWAGVGACFIRIPRGD